jgi:hypothetical protein
MNDESAAPEPVPTPSTDTVSLETVSLKTVSLETVSLEPQPIDIVLGQTAAGVRDAWTAAATNDPTAMVAMAETVALVERCRQLQVTPSPRYGVGLAAVVARAERAQRLRLPVARMAGPWLAAAAAAVTFVVLFTTDPLRRRPTTLAALEPGRVATPVAAAIVGAEPIRNVREVAWQSAVEQMRSRLQLEPSPHLVDALELGLVPPVDRLSRWLDSRNSLTLLRLDHELRASAELRREALRRQGGLPAADARVQQLATMMAGDLPTAMEQVDNGACDLPTVALVVRALLAAGPGAPARDRAVDDAADWLAARLPDCHGPRLVAALAALVEVAAMTGRHAEMVATHGQRLIDDVLEPHDPVWQRGLPELLGRGIAAAEVGDAGRLLRRLPGFGIDAGRAALVRQLLFGQLEARLASGFSGPELLTALWFGFDDLLPDARRDDVDRQLRRWQPVRLAPDFRTVQQLAWAIEPGTRGFTRWQGELRQLSVLPTPDALGTRAAFCLCLAANYAAVAVDGRSRLAGS